MSPHRELMHDRKFFQFLLKVYVWLLSQAYCLDKLPIGEIELMANYIVKDDNPDVGFELILGEVRDAEGNIITDPQGLTKHVESTDPAVLIYTEQTPGQGVVSFGSPGQASLQYSVSDTNGNVLGSGSDGFTVTTGDPASIASITGSFEGLTPEPEAPEAVPVEGGPAEG